MRALDIASTGMKAAQNSVDVTANNIANTNTVGFKRQNLAFADLVYETEDRKGVNVAGSSDSVPSGVEFGLGVRSVATLRDFGQGGIEPRGSGERNLNIAIQGKGFFVVEQANGVSAYTRNGEFVLNNNGEITTPSGLKVLPSITIPNNATQINISENGTVSVATNTSTTDNEVGKIQLATFTNEQGLESIGDNLFLETAASDSAVIANPMDEGFGSLRQGYVEISNASAIKEMTKLIEAQRSFENNSKVIHTADQMLKTVTDLKG